MMIGCKDMNRIELAQNAHMWYIFMMMVSFHINNEIFDLLKEYGTFYKEILPASNTSYSLFVAF
jgi:hypothetical protein